MTATQPFATSFTEAWQQFSTQRTTADESAFHLYQAMRERKSSFMAFLIPIVGSSIVEATRPAREALTQAGILDVLPSHYFHITVLPIALANDLPAGSIARMMDRTSRALRGIPSLRLTLRGVNSFTNAAFVEVHDTQGTLLMVRNALREAMNRTGIPGFGAGSPEDLHEAPFLPHMSICYYREQYPTAEVGTALEPFRDMEIGSLRVDSIILAAMPYSDYDRFPEITRIADLLLG